MDFTWLGRGAAMGGYRPTTWKPGPANQNKFIPTKGLYYRQKYSSVLLTVQLAGLRRSHKWRSRKWRSWAGVVTHGLQLWGHFDVMPNSRFRRWKGLMVEKLTFNSLVEIPAVNMPSACSLITWDICSIVLFDKTEHFRVAFWEATFYSAPV